MHTFFILILSYGFHPIIDGDGVWETKIDCVTAGRVRISEIHNIPSAKWSCQMAHMEIDSAGKIVVKQVGAPIHD